MAYTMKASTFTLATILNFIALEPKGINARDLKHKYQVPSGYPLADRLKGADHFIDKVGTNKLNIKYKITKAGRQYLKAHKDEIQADLSAVEIIPKETRAAYNKKPRTTAKAQPKQLEIIPPATSYSPAAQSAMDQLSGIIDANEQARRALEGAHLIVAGYFEKYPRESLPSSLEAGPFGAVINEILEFRSMLREIKSITEPQNDLQGVEVNEQSQASLIE